MKTKCLVFIALPIGSHAIDSQKARRVQTIEARNFRTLHGLGVAFVDLPHLRKFIEPTKNLEIAPRSCARKSVSPFHHGEKHVHRRMWSARAVFTEQTRNTCQFI